MTARQLPDRDYLALKAAARHLVKACGGGALAAASTRVRQQELSNYGNPVADYSERFMPADVVADLEAECGLPIVSGALAALSGHILVKPPETASPLGLIDLIGTAMRDHGEAIRTIIDARADGHIDEGERAACVARLDELERDVVALRLALMGEGTPTLNPSPQGGGKQGFARPAGGGAI